MAGIAKNYTELGRQQIDRAKEPISSEAPFSTNPDTVMKKLAREAFPDNETEQSRYGQKIKASLEEHLKITIQQLWEYLEKKGCKTASIIEGILRFYAGKKGENEIGIGRFLKTIFSAETSADKNLAAGQELLKTDIKAQLLAFAQELKSSHPDLPEYPGTQLS